jgi:hypothetical protein
MFLENSHAFLKNTALLKEFPESVGLEQIETECSHDIFLTQ